MFNSNLLLKVCWGERSWKNIWATRHRGGLDDRGQQPDPETNFRKNNPDSAGGSLLLVRCPVGSFCPGDVVCVSKQKQVDQRHWKGQKHDQVDERHWKGQKHDQHTRSQLRRNNRILRRPFKYFLLRWNLIIIGPHFNKSVAPFTLSCW